MSCILRNLLSEIPGLTTKDHSRLKAPRSETALRFTNGAGAPDGEPDQPGA